MQSLYWKRKLAMPIFAWARNRKIILLYHSVSNHIWGVKKNKFIDQINWLHDHCDIVSLHTLCDKSHNEQHKRIQVCITFDDGYASLFDNVLPVTDKYGIKILAYLNTGHIAYHQRKKAHTSSGHYAGEHFLVWDEVKLLRQANWEIGSHAVHHVDFSKMPFDSMQEELSLSKRSIEENINRSCLHFAYPWGKYNANAMHAVKQAGYQFATGVRHGTVKRHVNDFALPRINIAGEYSFDDFKDIVRGKWDYLKFIHTMKGL